MFMRSLLVACALVAETTVGTAAQSALVSENDFSSLVGLHAAAISPDAKEAVVVVSHVAWDDDRTDSVLVSIDLATHERKTLVSARKGLADPAFSPDGTRLAFLADGGTGEEARPQIFVMERGGTNASLVTHAKSGVRAFAWRPDGDALAYAAEDERPKREGADRYRDSFLFTTEPIVASSPSLPVHLFLADVGGGAVTQLTFGSESLGDGSPISWSPDGKTIALTLCRNAILNDQSYSRVALLDVASKRVRPLTGRTMWEGNALFSPDGAYIAYTYSNGDPQVALTNLYVTTPAGGPGRAISTAIDRPIGDAAWLPGSDALLVTAPDRTTNAFYRLSLRGTADRLGVGEVTPGIPLMTTGGAEAPTLDTALARDGTLLFLGTSTARPIELFTRSPGGETTRVSDFNAAMAQRFSWAAAERITFPTSAGVIADGVLYRPPQGATSGTHPLVVFIHGGPSDPSMLEFDFWAQVMAARGWLVLRPNYRGSPNLGLKYQRAILYDPEDGPGKDIMASIAAVSSRGIVDKSRIAVCGWSYGGIMTAWMVSKYHLWRAAVAGASVNDWIADYGTADDSLADADLFHGSPFLGTNAAEWRRASAISYAKDVTTPLLILSDVGDNRDPFATSSMYWRALRDNGKAALLRVWPVSGHFPGDPVRTVDVFHYWIDFIARQFG